MSFRIKKALAREILDSRGNPTVECDVVLRGGVVGRASVPSGASTGKHEARELRDGGRRFHGRGVLAAVGHVNSVISQKLIGVDCIRQGMIDEMMIALDGSKNKSLLGANAILAVSLAVARAAAAASKKPLYRHISDSILGNKRGKFTLPVPFCNVINGGRHAGAGLKLQEFMIAPTGFDTFKEAIVSVSEVYHELKSILLRKYGSSAINVGDEGGFAPSISSPVEALSLLEAAVAACGYDGKVKFAIDAAASEFYDSKSGKYEAEPGKLFSASGLADYYFGLARDFPIVSIEDPFEQESFHEFAALTSRLAIRNVQVVGDDLLVTDPVRIMLGIKANSCNCLLLKVNQVGTLTESVAAAKAAMSAGWSVMVSHRSGETDDPFIADLAVALGCGQIKAGAPARSERTAKYNRLLRIEEEMGGKSAYGI